MRCVGCHAATPDGHSVVFTDDWPWAKAAANITAGSIGSLPSNFTAGARALLKMPWWGTQSMTASHWSTGDRILLTSYGTQTNYGELRDKAWYSPPYDSHRDTSGHSDVAVSRHQLAWINLESTAPINVAVTDTPDYGQPLNDRNIAAAAAKGSGWGLVTRAPASSTTSVDGPYSNRFGKISIVNADGGVAVDLAANQPNACAGDSPAHGALNSFAAWAPEVPSIGGKRYYFLVFSSGRKYGDEFASQFQFEAPSSSQYTGPRDATQIYLTAVVVDEATGDITSYPALYLWSQNRLIQSAAGEPLPTNFSHVTPSWIAR